MNVILATMNFKFMSIGLFWLTAYGAFMEIAGGNDHAVTFEDNKCKFEFGGIEQELSNNKESLGSSCERYLCDFERKRVIVHGCPPPEDEYDDDGIPGYWPKCCKTKRS
uniref:Putative secreted protein n=1 Tax=Amblyomma americanum TaxID=6943 RepID=A0A0C9R476_AMBAM